MKAFCALLALLWVMHIILNNTLNKKKLCFKPLNCSKINKHCIFMQVFRYKKCFWTYANHVSRHNLMFKYFYLEFPCKNTNFSAMVNQNTIVRHRHTLRKYPGSWLNFQECFMSRANVLNDCIILSCLKGYFNFNKR